MKTRLCSVSKHKDILFPLGRCKSLGGGQSVSPYVVKDVYLFTALHAADFKPPVLSFGSFDTLSLAGGKQSWFAKIKKKAGKRERELHQRQ